MPVIQIDSLTDARLEPYWDLPRSNVAKRVGLFICEGKLLVDRLIESGKRVHSVIVEERMLDEYAHQLDSDVPIYLLPEKQMPELVGFKFHRGIIACGHRDLKTEISQTFLDTALRNSKSCFAVIGVGITNPQNMGGLLRNCAAFGVDFCLLDSDCTDPLSRRANRVAMGTNLFLPLFESKDLAKDLALLTDNQVQLIASSIGEDSIELPSLIPSRRIGVMFGNEGHGLSQEWQSRANQICRIEMSSMVDSLNVAVASGIFLHHIRAARSS